MSLKTATLLTLALAACSAEFETGKPTEDPFFQKEEQAPRATGPENAKYLRCEGIVTGLNMNFEGSNFVTEELMSSLAILSKPNSFELEMITLNPEALVSLNGETTLTYVSDNTPNPNYAVTLKTSDFVSGTAQLKTPNQLEDMSCEFFQSEK